VTILGMEPAITAYNIVPQRSILSCALLGMELAITAYNVVPQRSILSCG
jgi:hypothetical protein